MTPPRTAPAPRAIDFVSTGGARAGLGHVMRCATLANEARRRGWQVRVFLSGDEVVTRIWSERTGAAPDGGQKDWHPSDRTPIVALDFPEPKDDWIDRLEGLGLESLVIDDDRPTRPTPTWRMLPGLHHAIDAAATPTTGGTSSLVGGRFAILAKLHRTIPARPRSERDRLLVTLGGADPHAFTPGLAIALRDALSRSNEDVGAVDVVLGPAFHDPTDTLHDQIADLGFDVHRGLAPQAMGACMAAARLAIVGFGTSLTELAWHGTPFLCVPHHEADLPPARRLEQADIGRVLDIDRLPDSAAVVRKLSSALEDTTWQRRSAAAAQAALDGAHGECLLFDRLEADAFRRRAAAGADQPGAGAKGPGEVALSDAPC